LTFCLVKGPADLLLVAACFLPSIGTLVTDVPETPSLVFLGRLAAGPEVRPCRVFLFTAHHTMTKLSRLAGAVVNVLKVISLLVPL